MVARPSVPSSSVPQVQIPRWNKDPVWSLKTWPVILNVSGHDLEVPAMSAADWLAVLMQPELSLDDLLDVIPGADEVMAQVNLDADGWTQVCLDMIETVSSRSWWITMRLIYITMNSWDALGSLMLRRVDAEKVSLAAWLTVLTAALVEVLDPKDAMMALARIEAPPPEARDEVEVPEMSANQWLAMGR